MTSFDFSALIFVITWLMHSVFAISGLGGGIILIPIYITLGIPAEIAATIGLLMNMVALLIVSIHNVDHRIVRWKLGSSMLLPAIIMAPVGELLSHYFPREYVVIIFIVLLLYAFYHVLKKRSAEHREKITGKTSMIVAIPVGIVAGFLSGISGIGGGLIILPALTFMEEDYKKIVGTTAFVALIISAASFVSHYQYVPEIPLYLLGAVLSASILGGITASYLVHVLGSRKISAITGSVIVIIIGILIYTII